MPYNYSPAPHSGTNAFGYIPGAVEMPTSIYQQLQDRFGDSFINLGDQSLKNIKSQQSGNLSPGTWSQMQDRAAAFGTNMGQPGMSPLAVAGLIGSTGHAAEDLVQSGLNNYLGFVGGLSPTMDNPELAFNVATQNSVWNSAPDPTMKSAYEKQLMDEYLARMARPSGGGPVNMGPAGVGGGGNYGGMFSPIMSGADWISSHTNTGNPYSTISSGGVNNYSSGYDTSWLTQSGSNPYMEGLPNQYNSGNNPNWFGSSTGFGMPDWRAQGPGWDFLGG